MRTQRKTSKPGVFILLLTAFSVIGCAGDFSYKRGAGMGDFQQERASCADQNKTDYEIEQCLSKSGWVVVGIDKPLKKEQAKTITKAEDGTLTVDKEKTTTSADPLEKVSVSSWWKAGAGPDQLLAEGDSCVSELGDKYQPEANMSIVTAGLISCMKEKGWFALKQK